MLSYEKGCYLQAVAQKLADSWSQLEASGLLQGIAVLSMDDLS